MCIIHFTSLRILQRWIVSYSTNWRSNGCCFFFLYSFGMNGGNSSDISGMRRSPSRFQLHSFFPFIFFLRLIKPKQHSKIPCNEFIVSVWQLSVWSPSVLFQNSCYLLMLQISNPHTFSLCMCTFFLYLSLSRSFHVKITKCIHNTNWNYSMNQT